MVYKLNSNMGDTFKMGVPLNFNSVMNQNQKDVISERGMLTLCIVVGLILFCINPFIVVVLWLIWLLITSIIG